MSPDRALSNSHAVKPGHSAAPVSFSSHIHRGSGLIGEPKHRSMVQTLTLREETHKGSYMKQVTGLVFFHLKCFSVSVFWILNNLKQKSEFDISKFDLYCVRDFHKQ